jgi:hypothetical protein
VRQRLFFAPPIIQVSMLSMSAYLISFLITVTARLTASAAADASDAIIPHIFNPPFPYIYTT